MEENLLTFYSLKHSFHLDAMKDPTSSQPTLLPSAYPQFALILFWDFYLLTYYKLWISRDS